MSPCWTSVRAAASKTVQRTAVCPPTLVDRTAYRKLPTWTTWPLCRRSPLSIGLVDPGCEDGLGSATGLVPTDAAELRLAIAASVPDRFEILTVAVVPDRIGIGSP